MTPGDIKKLCFKELCWAKACEKLHWDQAGGLPGQAWQWTRVCRPGGLAVSPGQPYTCFVSKSLLSFPVVDLPVLWLGWSRHSGEFCLIFMKCLQKIQGNSELALCHPDNHVAKVDLRKPESQMPALPTIYRDAQSVETKPQRQPSVF